MQLVIPMSGFGERFRRAGYSVPKSLIEVNGRPMVGHVVDMFPGVSDVVFICNADHLSESSIRMEDILREICPAGRIVAVDPHKLGPVYAVLQADAVDLDRPVIVNYCDFTCYWDFAHFARFVAECGCDGAIPAYRGFHPHSLGSTFYAYVRERDGWAYDIQEKKPFSDNPIEEYASSGTYYFASGALMKQAFEEIMSRNINVNGEYYVSLAYKPLFEQSKRIAVYELQHFMQWGTPEDLAEYLQHDRVFRALADPERYRRARHDGALLMPMAGAGARFAAAGYELPKPLIPVSGRAMAVAATSELPEAPREVFVLRSDLPHLGATQAALKVAFPESREVVLKRTTTGQAITCLMALDQVEPAEPVTIGACDTGLLYDAARFEALMHDPSTDVIAWGFRGHDAARRWPASYGWIDEENGVVSGVAVKTPLRDPAKDPVIVGAFTFKRASYFKAAAERLLERNGLVNGEFYVDSCIEDAVALGLNVRLFEIDAYLCWGTPDELRTFEYWQSCFHKWKGHPYRLSRDIRLPLDSVDILEKRYAAVRPPLPRRTPQ